MLVTCLSFFSGASLAASDPVSISVVYPKAGQVVTAVDSTFILGHLTGDFNRRTNLLQIDGYTATIHPAGGFLAFIPVTPGDFVFKLRVIDTTADTDTGGVIASLDVPVRIPLPVKTIDSNSLVIAGDYKAPHGDLVLATGDRIEVAFRGTPGLQAWFSIDSVIDSVPMAEMTPRAQPYWGEAVFGAGAVPDTVMIGGVYSGFLDIFPTLQFIDKPVTYHLAPPDPFYIVGQILSQPADTSVFRWLEFLRADTSLSLLSSYHISVNPPEYPFTVRFTDSIQTIRHGPRQGYFAIFQPEGVEALAVGAEDGWYKIRLSETHFAWASDTSVEPSPKGIMPPRSYVRSLRTYGGPDSVLAEIPLSGKHPFRVVEDDRRTLRLQLFGVVSNTDWIRYDFSDPLIASIDWSQVEPDLYELRFKLTRDIWGYDSYYVGNTFYFKINKPPARIRHLRGKTIVIDPGHSADPGAIGPTGLTEAEANLGIALVLADRLRRKGANVVLTRKDDSDVPLYDRPKIARSAQADLFISIHNNALPDGVNPFTNNGVSTYYYHPHSLKLARAIQKEMIKATHLPDHGLFYGNLAVDRPTQYPAVLVECAFMILPEQEALLKTERYRRKVADAIVRGVEKFLKGVKE